MKWLRRLRCYLRGRHAEENEFGGGADCVVCTVCDARKCLRIYMYGDGPDKVFDDPQWRYPT